MNCPNCGAEIRDTCKICSFCGTRVFLGSTVVNNYQEDETAEVTGIQDCVEKDIEADSILDKDISTDTDDYRDNVDEIDSYQIQDCDPAAKAREIINSDTEPNPKIVERIIQPIGKGIALGIAKRIIENEQISFFRTSGDIKDMARYVVDEKQPMFKRYVGPDGGESRTVVAGEQPGAPGTVNISIPPIDFSNLENVSRERTSRYNHAIDKSLETANNASQNIITEELFREMMETIRTSDISPQEKVELFQNYWK